MFTLITDWKKQLITAVVFLFPVLCASLEHAGSSIFVVLMLFGLRFGWQGWSKLEKDEQQFFISLILFYLD